MVLIVELLAFVLVGVLGWTYYLSQVNKKQKEALKSKSKKLSEEEKELKAIKLKAFNYAKRATGSINGRYFQQVYKTVLDDMLKEEEAKKNLLG